jgi:tetratricopeptide (TPR) repeat protein
LIAQGYCLFPSSYILSIEEIRNITKTLYDNFTTTGWGTRGRGYVLLSLGKAYQVLGESQEAFFFYSEAINYAEESGYTQVKAKALTGMSEVHRSAGNFADAISKNLNAIEFLRQIGAKCDLAESHYQIGLSYQAIDEAEKSNINFHEAIRLFSEMEAPRQIERVMRSMEGRN